MLKVLAMTVALAMAPTASAQVNVKDDESNCHDFSGWASTCQSNTGTQVDVTAVTSPTPRDRAHSSTSAPQGPAEESSPPDYYWDESCIDDPTVIYGCVPVDGDEDIPAVTASDLASFTPVRPDLSGEPDGVGIMGAPTNIIAGATEHDVSGSLFGREVIVRFISAAYRFDYGDGASRTTTTGGRSWAALGQAQFTPTATSHVYRERGVYTVTVTTLHDAVVRWGSVWIPVTGHVESAPTGYDIRIVEAHTALVEHDCNEDPDGVGC